MKNHLKRNFAPSRWLIARKERKYILKPNPGAHSKELGLPLGVVLKALDYAQSTREGRKILISNDVLVDGKRRKDVKHIIGIMDVLSLPSLKKSYRVLLNRKGKLYLKEIDEKEGQIKICKIVGKCLVKGKKIQLNLHDGKNLLAEGEFKVGDSIVLSIKDNKIEKRLELKKGAYIYLIKGRYAGTSGVLDEIKGDKIVYQTKEGKIETLKDYAVVLGEKEPLIKIENES